MIRRLAFELGRMLLINPLNYGLASHFLDQQHLLSVKIRCFLGTCENMNNKVPLASKYIAAAIITLTVIVFSFFSNEARKEIYFLCGNFEQNDAYSTVIKQLNTANLSGYEIENTKSGKRIVHSSAFHLHLLRCNIDFNPDDIVISASYE